MRLAILILLLAVVGWRLSPVAYAKTSVAKVTAQRIIFFAPHPDDEMLGMGGSIWHAQHSSDTDYRVVIMTCGDAYKTAFDTWVSLNQARDLNLDGKIDLLDFGTARHNESLSALAALDVPPEKVIFLGYPDGGLGRLSPLGQPSYLSPFTNTDRVPYPFAYRYGAPYTADSVVSELKEIILNFDATAVYSTTPTDAHPDHAMTSTYVSQALRLAGGQRHHFEYLVHWESHMPAWPGQSSEWQDPTGHKPPDIRISLSTFKMDRSLKAAALKLYVTQANVEVDYLEGFAKDSEIFWNARPLLSDYLNPL